MDRKAATVHKTGFQDLTLKRAQQESKSLSPSKTTQNNEGSPEIMGRPSKELR